jgi:hypothetical protein
LRRLIFIFNIIILFFFWLAGILSITPAYNHFIQYGDGGELPVLTRVAIDMRFLSVGIPIAWAVISVPIFKTIQTRPKEHQQEFILLFILVSIASGFLMLLFYGIAAILPYLKIGIPI